jgi:hypothetical protein
MKELDKKGALVSANALHYACYAHILYRDFPERRQV